MTSEYFSLSRHIAQRKQVTRGNAPWQTRNNIEEVHADRGCYLTGLYYRKRLNEKLNGPSTKT